MIKITQMCDACGRDRQLALSVNGSTRPVDEAAREGGWREIRKDKHLCKHCIDELIK